jgi:hypothetical protein
VHQASCPPSFKHKSSQRLISCLSLQLHSLVHCLSLHASGCSLSGRATRIRFRLPSPPPTPPPGTCHGWHVLLVVHYPLLKRLSLSPSIGSTRTSQDAALSASRQGSRATHDQRPGGGQQHRDHATPAAPSYGVRLLPLHRGAGVLHGTRWVRVFSAKGRPRTLDASHNMRRRRSQAALKPVPCVTHYYLYLTSMGLAPSRQHA